MASNYSIPLKSTTSKFKKAFILDPTEELKQKEIEKQQLLFQLSQDRLLSLKPSINQEELKETVRSSNITSSNLSNLFHLPQDKYLFIPDPKKQSAINQATKNYEQKLLKDLEQEQKTLKLYEQQRVDFFNQQSLLNQHKQLQLRENQNYLLQQILDRQQAQLEFKKTRIITDQKMIDQQKIEEDLVNLYPPIRETPKEKRRVREKRMQRELSEELNKIIELKELEEKKLALAIKEEQHQIGLQKKLEEDQEEQLRKSSQRELYNKYAKDWKLHLRLINNDIIEEVENQQIEESQDYEELLNNSDEINKVYNKEQKEDENVGSKKRDQQKQQKDKNQNFTIETKKNELKMNHSLSFMSKSTKNIIDKSLIEKLQKTNDKFNPQSTRFKYDLESLKQSLESGNPKAVFNILNNRLHNQTTNSSTLMTPRHFLSQERSTPQRILRNLNDYQKHIQSENKLNKIKKSPLNNKNDINNMSYKQKDEDQLSIFGSQPSIFNLAEKEAARRFLFNQKLEKLQEKQRLDSLKRSRENLEMQDLIKAKEKRNILEKVKREQTEQIEAKRLKKLEFLNKRKNDPDIEGNEGYPRLPQETKIEELNKKLEQRQILQSFYELQLNIKQNEDNEKKQQDRETNLKQNQNIQQNLFQEREGKLRKEILMKEILQASNLDIERLQKLKDESKIKFNNNGTDNQGLLPSLQNKNHFIDQVNQNSLKLSSLINKKREKEINEQKLEQEDIDKQTYGLKNPFSNSVSLILQEQSQSRQPQINNNKNSMFNTISKVIPSKSINKSNNSINPLNVKSPQSQLYPWEQREKSVQQIRTLESLSSRKSFRKENLISNFHSQKNIL